MTENGRSPEAGSNEDGGVASMKDAWDKPEIVSYSPAKNAEGLSYTPGDGISNLTP